MKNSNNFVCIGIILTTHGLGGEVKVQPLTFDLQRFSELDKVFFEEQDISLEIERARWDKRFVYLKFKGWDSIDKVLKWKDEKIYIPEEKRHPLPENRYYEDDLCGKEVVDGNNHHLGEVVEIIDNPAHPILVVLKREGELVYVPFVKAFVKSVTEVIEIEPIEGMFS